MILSGGVRRLCGNQDLVMFFHIPMQINTSARFYAPQRPAWFARPFYPPGYRYPFHQHTFAEVFWVVQGRVSHRVGDAEEVLQPGDLRFIHPSTGHALGAGRSSAILGNLAFPVEVIEQLRPIAGPLPFTAGQAPGMRLQATGRAALEDWGDRLASQHISLLDVGSFLLWLVSEQRRPHAGEPGDRPAWLVQAVADLDEPAMLAAGAGALVRSTGRSPACVSRHVRKQFGCTVIQLINRRRLAWLAQQLRLTATPIPELAGTCGLSNLSHCYKVFRTAYGCPPGEYRARAAAGGGAAVSPGPAAPSP